MQKPLPLTHFAGPKLQIFVIMISYYLLVYSILNFFKKINVAFNKLIALRGLVFDFFLNISIWQGILLAC